MTGPPLAHLFLLAALLSAALLPLAAGTGAAQRSPQQYAGAIGTGYIRPACPPAAVIGLNLTAPGVNLTSLRVLLTPLTAGFDPSADLLPVSTGNGSGVLLIADNRSGAAPGEFDDGDGQVNATSATAAWAGPDYEVTLNFTGLPLPANDSDISAGWDLFIAVRASAGAPDGGRFRVTLPAGGVSTDAGPAGTGVNTTVTVDAVPPVAATGPDGTVDEEAAYPFDGTASRDERLLVGYRWWFGDGETSGAAKPLHAYSRPGRYAVVLTVLDGAGNTGEDFLFLDVRNVNDPPKITSVPSRYGTEGSLYLYRVVASDEDGDAINYSLTAGPAGAQMNRTTGVLAWVPEPGQTGNQSFVAEAADPYGASARQQFDVSVTDIQTPPRFVTTPSQTAKQGEPYTYAARAVDDDGDAVAYSLLQAPAGMAVNATSGWLLWTPGPADPGKRNVVLAATDRPGDAPSAANTAYQFFTVAVANMNDAPDIVSTPPATAYQDVPYSYQAAAVDADGDAVAYALIDGPPGMVAGSGTGLVTWLPNATSVGTWSIVIEARDPYGATDTQSFGLRVEDRNDPPRFTTLPPLKATVGVLYNYSASADDPDWGDRSALAYTMLAGPRGANVSAATGYLWWTPRAENSGLNRFVLAVDDGRGGQAVQVFTVEVGDVPYPPVFTTDPPTEAVAGSVYIYQARTSDPNGDAVTCELRTSPAGMWMDNTTGLVVWMVPVEAAGENSVVMVCSDRKDGAATQAFTVTVRLGDRPPVPLSTGEVNSVGAGMTVKVRLAASDPDGDNLTYSTDSPLLKVNPATGEGLFTAGKTMAGLYGVDVSADDGRGRHATWKVYFLVLQKREAGGDGQAAPLYLVAGALGLGAGGGAVQVLLALVLIAASAYHLLGGGGRRRKKGVFR